MVSDSREIQIGCITILCIIVVFGIVLFWLCCIDFLLGFPSWCRDLRFSLGCRFGPQGFRLSYSKKEFQLYVVHACVCVYIKLCKNIDVYTRIYIYIHIFICLFIISRHTHMHAYIHRCLCVYTYLFACVYMCIYVCICI